MKIVTFTETRCRMRPKRLTGVSSDTASEEAGPSWVDYKSLLKRKKQDHLQEHTAWANEVLRENKCLPISDLRRSIADGLTLVNLIEIITNEKIPGIHNKPVAHNQKVDNLQKSIDYIDTRGVDVQGLNSKDLTDGNLKSTLMLMNNIRKRYDTQYSQRDAADGAPQPPQMSSRPNSAHSGLSHTHNGIGSTHSGYTMANGDIPHMSQAAPKTPPATRPEYNGNMIQRRPLGLPNGHVNGFPPTDLLPGTMAAQNEKEHRPQLPPKTIMSTTELNQHMVSQTRGGEESRHYGHASSHPQLPPRPHSAKAHNEGPSLPPSRVTQAWQANVTPTRSRANPQAGMSGPMNSGSAEERLKSLMSNHQPRKGISNGAFHYDDEDMIVPPPPRPREDSSIEDGVDAVGRSNADPNFGYVPSVPTDRQGMSRAQGVMDAHPHYPSQLGPPGGAAPPPSYQPPPQYPRGRFSSSESSTNSGQHVIPGQAKLGKDDLRHACNKMYAPNGPSYPHVNGSHSPHPLQKFSPAPGRQPRASPMGQSSSSPPSQNSSQGPHSPNHPVSSTSADPNQHRRPPAGQFESLNRAMEDKAPYALADRHRTNTYLHYGDPQSSARQGDIQGNGPIHTRPVEQQLRAQDIQRPKTPVDNSQRPKTPVEHNHQAKSFNDFHSKSPAYGIVGPSQKDYQWGGTSESQKQSVNTAGPMRDHVPIPAPHLHRPNSARTETSTNQPPQSASAGLRPLSQPNLNAPQYAGSRFGATNSGARIQQLLTHNQTGVHNQGNAQVAQKQKWRDSIGSEQSLDTSRSVTPPLPPLSPSNTPPVTPPGSPGPQSRGLGGKAHGYLPTETPDVVTSASTGARRKVHSKKSTGMKDRSRRSGAGKAAYPSSQFKSTPLKSPAARSSQDLEESPVEEDDDYFDEASLTAGSFTEDGGDSVAIESQEIRIMRRQMQGLETMYSEILKCIGVDKEYLPESRRSVASSVSSVSRRGSRMRHSNKHSHRTNHKDFRQVNKRFQRLESHVVTLARSVAHLSSEMRGHNKLAQDVEELKKDVRTLKERPTGPPGQTPVADWERFRGWVPQITNPKRVHKLTKFFGQEPLLQIFLERLGYKQYIPNFEKHKIGILELPYMNEEKLAKIGIPEGPRQRILQEAQMSFRQGNFNIYIV